MKVFKKGNLRKRRGGIFPDMAIPSRPWNSEYKDLNPNIFQNFVNLRYCTDIKSSCQMHYPEISGSMTPLDVTENPKIFGFSVLWRYDRNNEKILHLDSARNLRLLPVKEKRGIFYFQEAEFSQIFWGVKSQPCRQITSCQVPYHNNEEIPSLFEKYPGTLYTLYACCVFVNCKIF